MTGNQAHQGKVEVREDEEQRAKLEQCLELLVAAGYFRARIQGLPPFDKVVGGMAWCIESCCIDLDVDLLYHDSLTIGQKISLTERLVSVLPALQCPHLLQPHQVQGLDAVHILPVMQWLVREALSRRAQYGSVSRAVAALHYNPRCPPAPTQHPQHLLHSLSAVQCGYECVRRWSVAGGVGAVSPQQRVHTTLLEYSTDIPATAGEKTKDGGPLAEDGTRESSSQSAEEAERQQLLRLLQQSPQHAVSKAASGVGLQALLSAAAAATPQQPPAPAPQATGASLCEQQATLQAQTAALQQLAEQEQSNLEHLQLTVQQARDRLQETKSRLHDIKTDEQVRGGVEELKRLLEEAERIKKAEHQYKDQCRQFAATLQQNLRSLEEQASGGPSAAPPALVALAQQERGKWGRTRDTAAAAALQLAQLRRAWDDVPGRAELAQYRHRLTELNDLVMSSERETQQFHTMYNTLMDSKTAMTKHLVLLNDILDNIQPGTKSAHCSAQLLTQVDAVLNNVQHNKAKVCAERSQQEAQRTEVNARLSALQGTARLYTRTAHALAHQLNKNQQLLDLRPS